MLDDSYDTSFLEVPEKLKIRILIFIIIDLTIQKIRKKL